MIRNQHGWQVTKAQLARLEEALKRAGAEEPSLQPASHDAMIAGLEAQAAELRQELEQYDSLRNRDATSVASFE